MYKVIVKSYLRHTENDNRFAIETVYLNDKEFENWKKKSPNFHWEILSYEKID